MNKTRVEAYKKHLKIHKYWYENCEGCLDRLQMCNMDGDDHIYDEHDSDCVRCGC